MNNYASPWTGYSPLSRDLLEQNPSGAYSMFANALSGGQYGGSPAMNNWLWGRRDREYSNFLGQAAGRPEMRWTDYLDQNASQFMGGYNSQSPSQRGQQGVGRTMYRY